MRALDAFMARRMGRVLVPAVQWMKRHLAWILVLLTIAFVVAVRVRLREMPLERDEGEYAYAGQLMLQGIPPYKLAYNMKLPGTYAAYAVILAVFGQTPAGIHLGLAVVNAASIVLVFLLGRRLLDAAAGVVAAITFGLMSLSPSVLGLAAHATHFVALPALCGALVLSRASVSGQLRGLFLSGLWFGMAFLMKQHGVMFGVFGLGYLAWYRRKVQIEADTWSRIAARSPEVDWRTYSRELGAYGAGLAVPYFLTCAVLGVAGVLPKFLFWTVSYAVKYISAVSSTRGAELFRYGLDIVTTPNLAFWLLAIAGAGLMWADRRTRKCRGFLAGFLVCSFLSVCIGMYFRGHYFILLLPALALLAGAAVSYGVHVLKQQRTVEAILGVPAVGLFALGLGAALVVHGDMWFGLSPVDACQRIYGTTLFPETLAVAEYARARTAEHSTLAVLGSEPQVYFYARRHSATGYIYAYPLMELHSYALRMQEEMIREIETARPECVVYVDMPDSWLRLPGSRTRLFDWWAEYSRSNYVVVRMVRISVASAGTLGEAAEEPTSPGNIQILALKESIGAGKSR